MNNYRDRRIIVLLLAIIMVLGSSVTAFSVDILDYDMELGENYSKEQIEAWEKVNIENRDSGLIGFDDEYELEDSNKKRTVIVEFRSQPAQLSKVQDELSGNRIQSFSGYEREAKTAHDIFRKELSELLGVDNSTSSIQSDSYGNRDLGITRVYENSINGVALEISENKIKELVELDTVFAVYPNIEFHQTSSEKTGIKSIGMQAEREFLNIDKLHEKGLTGKDIVIGVLDTGVDYNHPDLKDAFKSTPPKNYDGSLKPLRNGKYYGRNFHNDNYKNRRGNFDPMETTHDNWTDMHNTTDYPEYHKDYLTSYYTSHGTHVSGIVAAQGVNEPHSAKGMAPDAQLLVYRVLGPYGMGSTDAILEGIDTVVKDGCDIANLSLGAAVYHPYYITSIAVNNVILGSDIVFAVAAGNDGDKLYTVGSPGTASLPITVGNGTTDSIEEYLKDDDNKLKLMNKNWNTEILEKNGYYSIEGSGMEIDLDGNYDALVLRNQHNKISIGSRKDFEESKDKVKGKIVLINGGQDYIKTAGLAKEYNVGAVIVLNKGIENLSKSIDIHFYNAPLFVTDSDKSSKKLLEKVESSNKISFNDYEEKIIAGNKLNDRSSRGPVEGSYYIKPDIIAPGTDVISTVPLYMIGPNAKYDNEMYKYAYEAYSGTSMATPHIAGIAALMLEDGIPANQIKSRMMNTANDMTDYNIYEKGAGYINPEKALNIENYADVPYSNIIRGNSNGIGRDSANIPSISFGTSDLGKEFRDEMTINIHNGRGKKFKAEIDYNLEGRNTKNINNTDIKISLSENEFTDSVDVILYAPKDLKSSDIGSYEGYIVITEIGNETNKMKIPFAYYLNEANDSPAFKYIFFNRPTISVGDNKHVEMSSNADLYFEMARDIMEIVPLVLDPDTDEVIGRLYTESNLVIKGAYNIWGARNRVYIRDIVKDGKYYPVKPGSEDRFLENTEILDSGYHKINIQAHIAGSVKEDNYIDLYVDNNKPIIEEIKGLVDNTIEVERDKNIVIKGKIFDEDIEKMKELDIHYDLDKTVLHRDERKVNQSLNSVVGEINNNYYKADIDEEGNFSINIDENITEDSNLRLYIYDHYTPKIVNKDDIEKDFNPYKPSYADLYDNIYGYIGNNMGTMDINIKLTDRIDAKEPIIMEEIEDIEIAKGKDIRLSVNAKSVDGGELSYKWYRNNEPSNEEGLLAGTDKECEVLTDDLGVYYYYVVVTNKRDDVNGEKTASVKSDVIKVLVVEESNEEKEYNLKLQSGEGGNIVDIKDKYKAGEEVEIQAIAENGYKFSRWESEDDIIFYEEENPVTKFIMPAKDILVIAKFKEIYNSNWETEEEEPSETNPPMTGPVSPETPGKTEENIQSNNKGYIDINGNKKEINYKDISESVFKIDIDNKNKNQYIQISERELNKLIKKDDSLKIRVKTNNGIYNIPGNILEESIELDKILKDNNIKKEDIFLRLVINNEEDTSLRNRLNKQFNDNNSLSNLFGFEIQIINKDNKKIGTIDRFNSPITVLKPLDSEIKNIPKNYGAFKYDKKREEFRFTPHLYKSIDKNNYIEISTKDSSIFGIIENNIEYKDVNKNAWYYDTVKLASAKGLVKGVGYNIYQPELAVTRAEFIQMISNIIELKGIDDNIEVYSDISRDNWYYESVMQAKSSGILEKFNNKEFNGDREITREEMASVIISSIKYLELDIEDIKLNDISNIFNDFNEISEDYMEDIKLVYGLDIMEGMGDSRFAPKESLTRGQAAKVQINLLKFLEYIDKK